MLTHQSSPGRYIAAHMLKMLFAHIIIHYDFEELSERPGHIWASDLYLPKTVTLTCRRLGAEDVSVEDKAETGTVAGKAKVT